MGQWDQISPPKASTGDMGGSGKRPDGPICNGLKVFGSGELVWKTDVFGVLGEFRSEFRSASAPLAQLVEQRTFNPQVLGSSPRGRTNWLPYIW